jgi:hypothetical protein
MISKRDLLGSAGMVVLAVATARAQSAPPASSTARPSPAEARDLAEAGFIFGLPIVMNYAIMYEYAIDSTSTQYKAPFNQIKNEPNVFTPKDTAIITPNSDTPYSFAWLDVRAEPVVLSVPAVEPRRYYSIMLCDGNTYNFGYVGTRSTGSEAGSYLVVGPDWSGETPAGIKRVFRSSTQFCLAGYRTQLFGPADLDNVKQVQAGYKVQTLSAYLNRTPPKDAAPIVFPKIDKDLFARDFFKYLDFALQFAPPQDNEADVRAKLARIGIGPGKRFDFDDLSADIKQAIGRGMMDAQRKVDEGVANVGKSINGWRLSGLPGNMAHYNGDWLKRAVAAQAGIYGNDAEEATYPLTRVDSDGQLLDGSKHSYTLTFPAGELPPVNAFWSLTMYDGRSQLLIENPINRYLINSPMLPTMKMNADGSLTLFIQHQSPGPDKESNWLPAPNGPIYLVMRLYWPRPTPPSVLPPGEGTWRPPGVKRVS